MNDNTKLEVAVEILTAKIAITLLKGFKLEDEKMKVLI
jgi:hypothetical protein